jgi:hypothetical protein
LAYGVAIQESQRMPASLEGTLPLNSPPGFFLGSSISRISCRHGIAAASVSTVNTYSAIARRDEIAVEGDAERLVGRGHRQLDFCNVPLLASVSARKLDIQGHSPKNRDHVIPGSLKLDLPREAQARHRTVAWRWRSVEVPRARALSWPFADH